MTIQLRTTLLLTILLNLAMMAVIGRECLALMVLVLREGKTMVLALPITILGCASSFKVATASLHASRVMSPIKQALAAVKQRCQSRLIEE